MGFKDLYAFNKALLAKQAWRLVTNPNSLLGRLYKGRYYHSTTFLQSSNITHSSYGWKSIQAGKELLCKGLSTLIADGVSTNVWSDQWLSCVPPRRLLYPTTNPDMKVADLMVNDHRSWNIELLNSLFSPEDSQVIQSIKLSEYASEDCYFWPYTKDMKYSVKSGYWVCTHDSLDDDLITPPQGSLDLKAQVWKLNILPKIKIFLWRVLSGALSTYTQLCARGIHVDPLCQRCCLEEESINHILFGCPFAIATWRCSDIPLHSQFTQDLEGNISLIFQFMKACGNDRDLGLRPFWIMWIVWKSRNEFLFNRRNVQPSVDAQRGYLANAEWIMTVKDVKTVMPTHINRSSQWEPPPPQWLKCNFDCSFSMGNEFTAVGWIIRDENGRFRGAASMKLKTTQVHCSLVGEAYAFLFALQQIWVKGWRRVWFESDNLELTRIINTKSWHLDLGNLLFDIRYWMSKLPECSIEHVNRERNQAADIIAKKALESESLFHVFNAPPCWIVDLLYYPFTV